MKQRAFRQNKTGVAPPLKILSPAEGTSDHEYELYHVNQLHITSTFARWVYDLPGEICCFLRPASTANNSLKKISKRRRLAGRRTISIRSMCGKGGTHLIPHRGGENVEPNRREFFKQCSFQKYCNTVLHNEACDAHKELRRHKTKEVTISDLTLEEAWQLHTFDEYFKRETAEEVFEKAGKKITPKLLLEAIVLYRKKSAKPYCCSDL